MWCIKAKIEHWYKHSLWTAEMVAKAVAQNIITAEDFKEITGEEYKEAKNGN